MFTPVNFRCVNTIRQVLSDAISNDDASLRQVPLSVESRKRVEEQRASCELAITEFNHSGIKGNSSTRRFVQ
jgi:hypothetical protein